jgi:hypothetical protein
MGSGCATTGKSLNLSGLKKELDNIIPEVNYNPSVEIFIYKCDKSV